MELKDISQPKWVPTTKRGVGMILAFFTTLLPFISGYVKVHYGVTLDAPLVALFGEVLTNLITTVGTVVGFVLWVWGSFRPTGPLTVLPPKA